VTAADVTHGECLCGAVTYAIAPPYPWFANCHCSMCRKQHGALFGCGVGVARERFEWLSGESDVVHYRSSAEFERPFCRRCGSKVPGVSHLPDVLVVPAGALDSQFAERPRSHIFVASKSPLCSINDRLPQYAAYPPAVDLPVVAPEPRPTRPGFVSGSCLCGAVGYEVQGGLHRLVHCHCSLCRRSRGTPFASTAFTSPERFRFTRGRDRIRAFRLPAPRTYETDFCTACGSLVPTVVPDFRFVLIPAGSIDTPLSPLPGVHIYVGSRARWHEITDDEPRFDEMPPPDRFNELFF
jgi:hypothetical protein